MKFASEFSRFKVVLLGLLVIGGICYYSSYAWAAYKPIPAMRIFQVEAEPILEKEINIFPRKDIYGGNLLVSDLGTDNIAEIIYAGSLNTEPRVRILQADGTLIRDFLAYTPSLGRGVNLATGDLNGDGIKEIITGTGYKAGPHIRMFDGFGQERFLAGGFFAYDSSFRGGVNVSAGDIDGDGKAEIITAPGFSGGSHVKVFNQSGETKYEFFAFDPMISVGFSIATGRVLPGKNAQIIVAGQGNSQSNVRVYSLLGGKFELMTEFLAFDQTYHQGVNVTVADIIGDNQDEIIVMGNGKTSGLVKVFSGKGELLLEFSPYTDKELDGLALRLSAGDIDGDGKVEIVTMPHYYLTNQEYPDQQWIEVDLAKQQLYVWEYGYLAHTFLISSGLNRFPTPVGEYSIFRKLPIHDYIWSYGEGNVDNYDLRNVQYNLNFKPHFYIHYAYWHNNFGYQMSHGCVNAPYNEVKWLYEWAELDTLVKIHW